MGGLCSGLGAPEIDVDAETIAGEVSSAVEGLVQTIPDNERKFKEEVNKCDDDGKFEVPDTTLVLTKTSTDDEIRTAAVTSAFASDGRDRVKETVRGALEPTIDEQLDQAEGVPQKIKNVAKDKFFDATVYPAVDKALDEALEKAKKGDSA